MKPKRLADLVSTKLKPKNLAAMTNMEINHCLRLNEAVRHIILHCDPELVAKAVRMAESGYQYGIEDTAS